MARSTLKCPFTVPPLLKALIAVLTWVFGGTLIYWCVGNSSEVPEYDATGQIVNVEYATWTFAQSFYYSVQAGLSIGFGRLTETKELSRLYTIFHILAGSSFIVGALVYFLQMMLAMHTSWQNSEERRLAKFSRSIQADGYNGFNIRQMHDLLICQPMHLRDILMRLSHDAETVNEKMEEFNNSNNTKRAAIVDAVLAEACQKLEEFKQHSVSIPDLMRMHHRESSWCHRLYHFMRANRTILRQLIATLVWLAIGVVFICVTEGVSFITGVYFAVSSLSSAGLYAVISTSNGSVWWFVGVWTLIGVPLYGVMLGSYATALVEQYSKEQVAEDMHKRMTRAEVEFLSHLVKEQNKEAVDFGDFVQIQLLRLGYVDRELLAEFRADFNKRDVDGRGTIPTEAFLPPAHAKLLKHQTTENLNNFTAHEVHAIVAEASQQVEV